ncbi:reverse transcriptase domain-containing protein [Heliorestis acidaminivorans]|uniref:reverse transcriptase domain-containing protein n=1 Tax=Heliorestis acidaminivorans TaxID=553427 RepID=UPI002430682F|nr:reverse transcriptase domain-containing protein [Heliorestis acidaminivorans]
MLTAVYEPVFHACSFGYRPKRGCHDALKALEHSMFYHRTQFVVDADIKGFFDNVDHQWMIKFLQHRIADHNLIRLIVRFLKAGVMEAGIVYNTPVGTPQGESTPQF